MELPRLKVVIPIMLSKSFELIISWIIDKKMRGLEQLCFHYFDCFCDEENVF